MSEIFLMPVV